MIIADTGAILALIDADDLHHDAVLELYEENPDAWVLPWAVLPEVDYLLLTHVGPRAELAFMRDVADARYLVEWGSDADLRRARELCDRYQGLRLGIVDSVVMAMAERLRADTIATLDVRHFGAVDIRGTPRIFPRDRWAG